MRLCRALLDPRCTQLRSTLCYRSRPRHTHRRRRSSGFVTRPRPCTRRCRSPSKHCKTRYGARHVPCHRAPSLAHFHDAGLVAMDLQLASRRHAEAKGATSAAKSAGAMQEASQLRESNEDLRGRLKTFEVRVLRVLCVWAWAVASSVSVSRAGVHRTWKATSSSSNRSWRTHRENDQCGILECVGSLGSRGCSGGRPDCWHRRRSWSPGWKS